MLKVRLQTAARFPLPSTRENTQDLLKRVRGGVLTAELVVTRHQQLEKVTQPDHKLWVLDERGKAWSSETWSDNLRKLADEGTRNVTILVGAADGFDKEQRAAAHQLISISPGVLPSWLACLTCAEQIYRADTIIRGTPYHRS